MKKKRNSIAEFNYKLTQPVKVAKNGDEELVFIVKLKSPTAKHRSNLIRLKQGFLKAAMSAQRNNLVGNDQQKNQPDQEDTGITGEAIMALLYISDIDLAALEEEFRLLLLAGAGEVGDGVKLNPIMLEEMSLEDFEGMMGEYFANFIVSSSI